jgi:uncharacterized protein YegJ (DUF2314 family)
MRLANAFDDGWELDDGEAINREAPDTFFIPPKDVRQSLAVGQTVKLVFRISVEDEEGGRSQEVERMWVVVEKCLTDGQYVGALNNDPYCTDGIQAGMQVIFEPRHIIQIYERPT